MSKTKLTVLGLAVLALSGGCSCESYYAWKDIGPVPESIAHKAYWSKECKAWAAPLSEDQKTVAQQQPRAINGKQPYVISRTYPSQHAIRLEKKTPKDVQLGSPFRYSIRVTNLTDMPLDDVVVVEQMPNGFDFTGASPQANQSGSTLTWRLGALAPKADEEMTVSGVATSAGSLTSRATVTYAVPARADVQVLQAVLTLERTAPAEVLFCEPVPVTFTIKNTGNGSAKNVIITDSLPAGLVTVDGKNRIVHEVGTLGPGQTKQFTSTLKATRAGTYTCTAVATSSLGVRVESAATTTAVRQPVLTVSKEGPDRQYIGRAVTYEITVSNVGDGPAGNTMVEDTIPPGVTSITASEGGIVGADKVTWALGTIAANHFKKVTISYASPQARDLDTSTTVTAYCASKISANAHTTIVGVPAILLEVVDVGDPIEVGDQGTYIITATNQGSSPATNIRITCRLEDKMKCVSLGGATPGTLEANRVTFVPLASLAPGAKAVWRVEIRADRPGDVLFRVSMTTDEFARSIEETESTNLYE